MQYLHVGDLSGKHDTAPYKVDRTGQRHLGNLFTLILCLWVAPVSLVCARTSVHPAGGEVGFEKTKEFLLPVAHKATSFTVCPTITNTSLTTVTICTGRQVDLLEVNTTAVAPYTIEFVRFDEKQVNPYTNMVGEFVGEASPSGGTASITNVDFPANTGTTDRIYYVYACLKPVPVDETCIPFAYITVIVKPNPTASLLAKEATCSGVTSATDGYVALSGYAPTDTYELLTNGVYAGVGQPIPANGRVVSGLSRTGTSQVYTVRVYSGAGCYAETSVNMMNAPCECPPPRCVPITIQKTKSAHLLR